MTNKTASLRATLSALLTRKSTTASAQQDATATSPVIPTRFMEDMFKLYPECALEVTKIVVPDRNNNSYTQHEFAQPAIARKPPLTAIS
jgi:hypothetical protein